MRKGEPGRPGAAFAPINSNHSVNTQLEIRALFETRALELRQKYITK